MNAAQKVHFRIVSLPSSAKAIYVYVVRHFVLFGQVYLATKSLTGRKMPPIFSESWTLTARRFS